MIDDHVEYEPDQNDLYSESSKLVECYITENHDLLLDERCMTEFLMQAFLSEYTPALDSRLFKIALRSNGSTKLLEVARSALRKFAAHISENSVESNADDDLIAIFSEAASKAQEFITRIDDVRSFRDLSTGNRDIGGQHPSKWLVDIAHDYIIFGGENYERVLRLLSVELLYRIELLDDDRIDERRRVRDKYRTLMHDIECSHGYRGGAHELDSEAFVALDHKYYGDDSGPRYPEMQTRSPMGIAPSFELMEDLLQVANDRKLFVNVEGSGDLSLDDLASCQHFATQIVAIFFSMPSKWVWGLEDIKMDINLAARGYSPRFILPKHDYSGTKSNNPLHKTLRTSVARTVASLMLRGLSLKASCDRVADTLKSLKATTNKNGKSLSSRTIKDWYEREKRKSAQQMDNELSLNAWIEMDQKFFDPGRRGEGTKGALGVPPLEWLKWQVQVLMPLH